MSTRIGMIGVAALWVATGCARTPAPPPAMAGMQTPAHAATPDPGAVRLTPAQASAIGVTYTTVATGPLTRPVRTVGEVAAPESTVVDVTVKVDGYVERMYVATTGVPVRRGQPLLSIYSPTLVAAQQELLTALGLVAATDAADPGARSSAMSLLAATRRRLANADIPAAQVARLEHTGEVTKTLTLTAPVSGVVLDKAVVEGQSVETGAMLYRLADLSTVWIDGAVFEQDLALLHVGARAQVEFASYPGRTWTGRITFISPVVDSMSRTAVVRVSVANREGLLKPGMYATLFLLAPLDPRIPHVPADAVVRTGERDMVYVARPDGTLEPQGVTLGLRAGDQVQVLSGVRPGQRIVASANFLVDAESHLTTGGTSMAGMPGMDTPPAAEVRP